MTMRSKGRRRRRIGYPPWMSRMLVSGRMEPGRLIDSERAEEKYELPRRILRAWMKEGEVKVVNPPACRGGSALLDEKTLRTRLRRYRYWKQESARSATIEAKVKQAGDPAWLESQLNGFYRLTRGAPSRPNA